jgi:hypothetical protein
MPHRNNMICCICESKCHFGAGGFEFYRGFCGNYETERRLDPYFAVQHERSNIAARKP